MSQFQFDNTAVTIINDTLGHGLAFTHEGKRYEISEKAQFCGAGLYQSKLIRHDCDEFVGEVVWYITNPNSEDESDWTKFDVYF